MHAIDYLTFDSKKDKKYIVDSCCRISDRNGDYSGQIMSIRFIDKIFDDEDVAHKYIQSIDNGRYDNIAVKFKTNKQKEKTKAIKDMEVKILEIGRENRKKEMISYAQTVKSEFFACKDCKSKLNREKMLNKGNRCPVCGAELRSDTTMNQIRKANLKLADLQSKYKEMVRKNSIQDGISWLVKIEYHC